MLEKLEAASLVRRSASLLLAELFATTEMGLENIMLSKISETEKVKSLMISLVCGI